jgi:putative ABC transport system permease protein
VLPGYTESMGIRLIAGRTLAEADNQAGALSVVVVDEKLAEQTWPNEDPVGKGMQIVRFDFENMQLKREHVQVVGVVRHIRSESLTADGRGSIYYPYRFFPWWPMKITVRGASDPLTLVGAIRAEVAALDGDVPVADVRLMTDYVDDAMAQTRFTLVLIGLFAALALILASVGLYGVIAYSLRQRVQEIGVRMAFGAGARSIVGLVVSHGVMLALCGVGVGLVAALVLTRTAASLLFGVSPFDAVTFAGIPLLLVGVTSVASYIPARRATRIDPIAALRGGSR